MLFSYEWLRSQCPTDADAERAAAALTARGLTVDSVTVRPADAVFDVDVPANRPDCLGHRGVARELCATLGLPLAALPGDVPSAGAPAADSLRVEIEDPALCHRYTARLVRGVRIGPSPEWVTRRLESCGLRSINNVIDASNLVLLELGHPIHFFDNDLLDADAEGNTRILVRRARRGEPFTTLDGVEHELDSDMLVIADGERAVALAGIMGGASTEIRETTHDVLIEAAHFDPQTIRRTSRRLGLQTDSSYRFERRVDPQGLIAAQNLAVHLLHELAGGRPAPDVIDNHPRPYEPRKLTLREAQVGRLLGFQPDRREILGALSALGLEPTAGSADGVVELDIPSRRPDLEREADLVEEIARHIGYDKIPSAMSGMPETTTVADRRPLGERCREVLAHRGFAEAFGYSMIAAGEDDRFAPGNAGPAVPLTNPIAGHLALLRRSILPALLKALDLNLRRGNRDVRLFEVGRVFLPGEEGRSPREQVHLGLAWTGAARPRHWSDPDHDVDLYDLIGVVELLLAELRPGVPSQRSVAQLPSLHPGRSVAWSMAGTAVGWGGALHPDLQASLDQPVFLAELDVDQLTGVLAKPLLYDPLPRLPAVTRDLAVVLGDDQTCARVLEVLRSVEPPAPIEFDVVDRYTGPPLEDRQASLTIRFTLQPRERTLTDEETEGFRQALVQALKQGLGLQIRV